MILKIENKITWKFVYGFVIEKKKMEPKAHPTENRGAYLGNAHAVWESLNNIVKHSYGVEDNKN